MKEQNGLVACYGDMWARNEENLKAIPGSKEGGIGIYILHDGSLRMYVGIGKIKRRIARHARERSQKHGYRDHFSWFALREPERFSRELEALLLGVLQYYLQSLNKQRGKFAGAKRILETNSQAIPINRPKLHRPRPKR